MCNVNAWNIQCPGYFILSILYTNSAFLLSRLTHSLDLPTKIQRLWPPSKWDYYQQKLRDRETYNEKGFDRKQCLTGLFSPPPNEMKASENNPWAVTSHTLPVNGNGLTSWPKSVSSKLNGLYICPYSSASSV